MTRGFVSVAILALSLSAAAGCTGSSTRPHQAAARVAASQSASDPQLTGRGQRVEDLEALLKRTFGASAICTRATRRHIVNFVAGDCAPLSEYSPYFFAFRHPRATLRLGTTTRPPRDLGNYSVPIQLDGRYVTCGSGRYLVKLADAASFTLDCVRPL